MQLADLVRPLIAARHADALEQPYLCTDATGVLVQFPERCNSGHFWVLVAASNAWRRYSAPEIYKRYGVHKLRRRNSMTAPWAVA